MEKLTTPIQGLYVLKPKVFTDSRGYFFESWNRRKFCDLIGEEVDFVQDNQSLSKKGALRGLHFQNPPFAQGKLVRVMQGSVLDVAVDLRKTSPTYGKHFSIELSAENMKMLWIPPGFAHGFLTLEDNTVFSYKCTAYYDSASEETLLWNDPELNINWPVDKPELSEKDKLGNYFAQYESAF